MGGTNVFAEELQEYTLDQMVVTATRMETRDVATPATTTIIKSDDIKKLVTKMFLTLLIIN